MPAAAIGAVVGAGIGAASANSQKKANQKMANDANAAFDPLLGRAQALADRAYVGYTGETVAGPSVNQQTAISNAALQGGRLPEYSALANRQFTGDTVNQYMNPYTSNVLDVSARKLKEGYGEESAALNRKSGMTDAFGIGRSAALKGELNKNYQQGLSDLYTTGLGRAFETGRDQFNADTQRFGQMEQNTMGNLMQTGGLDRDIQDAISKSKYAQFLEKRDWSSNNIQPLLSAMGAKAGANVSAAPVDTLGNIIGMASIGAGIGGKFGGQQAPNPAGTGANVGAFGQSGNVIQSSAGGNFTSPSFLNL